MIAILFFSFRVCLLPPAISWNEQIPIISFNISCTYADASQFNSNISSFKWHKRHQTIAAEGGSILFWKNNLFKDAGLERPMHPILCRHPLQFRSISLYYIQDPSSM